MSVGATDTKQAIDQSSYGVAAAFRTAFRQARDLKTFLDRLTPEDLVAKGYDAGQPEGTHPEVDLLKSAVTQLVALADIAEGKAGGQTAANDYLFFSNQLLGPNSP